jgi:hypothetical protein
MLNKLLYSADLIGSQPAVTGFLQPGEAAGKIAGFFNLFFIFITIAAVFFFMRGGLDYVMSGGDPGKVKVGMAAIQYSIIGLIVAAVGFLVIGVVKSTLGIGDTSLGL